MWLKGYSYGVINITAEKPEIFLVIEVKAQHGLSGLSKNYTSLIKNNLKATSRLAGWSFIFPLSIIFPHAQLPSFLVQT